MTITVGQQIGSYRIVQEISHGQYAAIYKATHTILKNRIVALKLLRKDAPGGSDKRGRPIRGHHHRRSAAAGEAQNCTHIPGCVHCRHKGRGSKNITQAGEASRKAGSDARAESQKHAIAGSRKSVVISCRRAGRAGTQNGGHSCPGSNHAQKSRARAGKRTQAGEEGAQNSGE